MSGVVFAVQGTPRPKQSFRYKKGGGYTAAIVKAWQNDVSWAAKIAMQGRPPHTDLLSVEINFYLPDRHRRDIDNLSKCVLDGMNKIVFEDDQQVVELYLTKVVCDCPGVLVSVEKTSDLTQRDSYLCELFKKYLERKTNE